MKKEALLLIDIQDMYFTPEANLLYRPREAAMKAAVLLRKFREEGKTIIHVKHNVKMFSEINNLVEPREGEKIITKDYPSAFLGTDLQEYLKDNGIERIIVVGMMSHMCVDTTVRACQDYDYEVVVIEDACTTKDLIFQGRQIDAIQVHATFMAALDGMFAKVMKLEDYI